MPLTRRLGTAAVVVSLALTTACSGTETAGDGNPAQSDDGAASDMTDPVDPVRSGVGILADGCGPSAGSGSGVAVGEPGQIVTVAHTVAGATQVSVVDGAGTAHSARVIAFDPSADLAVLHVDAAEFGVPPLPVIAADPVAGPSAMLRWTKSGGVEHFDIEVTTRLAITIDDIYGLGSVERSGLEIAADIEVGDSGGPVLSAGGEVIGIIYARSRSRPGTAFATDAAEVRSILATVTGSVVDNGACV